MKERGIQGTVYLRVVIEKDGRITHIEISKSADSLLDKEAVRVVANSPNWNPAKKRGVSVRVYFYIPIKFTLYGNNNEDKSKKTDKKKDKKSKNMDAILKQD